MEQPIKALVVDDSADDRFILIRALKKAGLLVETFETEDGTEAIEYLSHAGRFQDAQAYPRPDLIFLDLKMPGKNGFDVLRWFREFQGGVRPPIVVLSGSELERDICLARELGATTYLAKPATPAQLRELVCSYLGLPCC